MDLDLYNYSAIAILEHRGNRKPTQLEIDTIETELRHLCTPDELTFESLTPLVIAGLALQLAA
jgi:hypothetical protein